MQRNVKGMLFVGAVMGLVVTPLRADLPVSGAAFHLDANDTNTVLLDGSSVTNWQDKGSSGLDVTPPMLADRPTLVSWPAKAGLSAVRFNLDDRLMNATDSPFANAGPWTVFTVFEARKTAGSGGNIMGGSAGDARGIVYFYNNSVRSFRGGTEFANSAYTNGQYLVYSAVWNGAASSSWINGTNQATGSVGDAVADGTDIDIGNEDDGGVYAGDIAEIAIYNSALTDSERENVESYLYDKWLMPLAKGTVFSIF